MAKNRCIHLSPLAFRSDISFTQTSLYSFGMTTIPPLTVFTARQVWSTSMSPSGAHIRHRLSTHSNLEIADDARSPLDSPFDTARTEIRGSAVPLVDGAEWPARRMALAKRRRRNALFIFCRPPRSQELALHEDPRLRAATRRCAAGIEGALTGHPIYAPQACANVHARYPLREQLLPNSAPMTLPPKDRETTRTVQDRNVAQRNLAGRG